MRRCQAEVKERFAKVGVAPWVEGPDATNKRIAEEAAIFAETARKVGLKPE